MMILRAVFAVYCVARLTVAPYSSLVRTEVSVEDVETLRALHEKNEEVLDLYWGGDATSALAVLKSALSPSEVEAFKATASSMLLRKNPSTAMQTVMKDNAAVRKLTSTSKENQGSKLLKRPTLDRYPE